MSLKLCCTQQLQHRSDTSWKEAERHGLVGCTRAASWQPLLRGRLANTGNFITRSMHCTGHSSMCLLDALSKPGSISRIGSGRMLSGLELGSAAV